MATLEGHGTYTHMVCTCTKFQVKLLYHLIWMVFSKIWRNKLNENRRGDCDSPRITLEREGIMVYKQTSHLISYIKLHKTICLLSIPLKPGEVTPLSSWKPCATEKNLHFLSCITNMGQNFIKCFLGVDIHGIYYIVETDNQIWCNFFSRKHTVSN
jgi:hypothetical protein